MRGEERRWGAGKEEPETEPEMLGGEEGRYGGASVSQYSGKFPSSELAASVSSSGGLTCLAPRFPLLLSCAPPTFSCI